MGQKVNPIAYRLPLIPASSWKSRWFTTNPQRYQEYLMADTKLRQALMKKLAVAGVARGGSGLEEVKKFIYEVLEYQGKNKNVPKIDLQIEEIKEPDLNAHLVAIKIADQLAKRLPARRVVKKAMERTIQARAGGVKILLAGRVGGAEISRKELYQMGSVPLQTLRADIDYAQVPSLTRSGYVGVKVWIHRGEKTVS